jgi:hypothetical protein
MTMPKPRILLTAVLGLLGLSVLAVPSQLRAETVKASEIFSLESVRAEFINGSINGTAYDRLTYSNVRSGSSDPGDTDFPTFDGKLTMDWQQAVLTFVLVQDTEPVNVTWTLGKGRLSGFSPKTDTAELDLFRLTEQLSFDLFETAKGNAEITKAGSAGFSGPIAISHSTLDIRDFSNGISGHQSENDHRNWDLQFHKSIEPVMDIGEFAVADMTITDSGHTVSVAELSFRKRVVDGNQNLSFDMDIVDFDAPRDLLENSQHEMVWKFLEATDAEKILLNFGLTVNFDIKGRQLTVTRSKLSLLDLMVLDSTISLSNLRIVDIAIPATAYSLPRTEQQLVGDLDRFGLTLEDIGFVKVAADFAATPPQTGRQLRNDAVAIMRAKAAQASSPAGKAGYTAIADFVRDSGTLRIEAEPQQKVSVREAFPLLAVSLDFAAHVAGFRVTHEP